ncbi:hypothetical protein TSOC_006889 [Tetrabaena socialis]|uniref:Glycosyltransferase family 92 protein n=1 Tax=Tetrabaena socialis TaxID=47790 RepID=A0A2J8A2H6_9CHLO|nr:hypothetical protein TSOC_006889 [Tetrabaena socialis]|eukprot:PNH06720.1 hypothetical protein TSOC_006889 [Tetrabaena socialis]
MPAKLGALLLLLLAGASARKLAHHEPGYLAICLLARDGNRSLREWIEYHFFAGVDKVFVFDHNSTTPMLSEVSDYAAEGRIHYTYLTSDVPQELPLAEGLQGRVFRQCFEQARGYYTWMAFTDLNEFLLVTDPKYNHSIPAVLRTFESYRAVMVQRRRLGSMGIQRLAEGQDDRMRRHGGNPKKAVQYEIVERTSTLDCQAGRDVAPLLAHHEPKYLAMCLLARDGNRELREWVEYHFFAGADKIFLFDHNSTVPMISEVLDYVAEGRVQYTYFNSDSPRVAHFAHGLQGRVFQQCFEQARGYFKWMAFTDLDEYLLVTDPKYNNSIPDILRQHESQGAVVAHWQRLGSMGIPRLAEGQEVLPTFTKCMQPVEHLKGIANLEFAFLGPNAHMFTYQEGKRGVRPGDGVQTDGTHALPNPIDTPLVVYHYNGAALDWQDRVGRLGGGVSGFTTKKSIQYEIIDKESTYDCTAGRDVAPLVPRRPKPAAPCTP